MIVLGNQGWCLFLNMVDYEMEERGRMQGWIGEVVCIGCLCASRLSEDGRVLRMMSRRDKVDA
jgi:hypothetical protein